jgi:hypothetical protein
VSSWCMRSWSILTGKGEGTLVLVAPADAGI